MATKGTLKLRAIQPRPPRFRVVHGSPARDVRRVDNGKRRASKHTRVLRFANGDDDLLVQLTKARPWDRRARRRVANRIARASRKANR